ncbi:MAG TPA: urease accessory protein UreD [Terriglobia bacterium]|nr:urease accessory protein UreD [Terriglobia bacterium]
MDLTFVLQNSQTVLRHAYCEIPFKITRVLNSREPAHLILMQCTAGLFGGDDVECSIRVERGARVLITQQSATKIHPSEGRPAMQRNHVIVESGAVLQLYLEPVIPFADSSLRQTTRIDVQPGGRLMFWEGFMAGRVGRGERWQFHELASETQLRSNERSVYLDRFRLPNGFERSACAMGECSYLGTGLYVGEQAQSFALSLHQALPEAGIDTPVADVAVVRVVSKTGPDFHRSREMFCLHASAG